MSPQLKKVLSAAILLAAIPVLAQNVTQGVAPDNADTSGGIAAFNQGDYQRALMLFEAAEIAGNQADSLDYNIAVSLYRLGRYGEARERFMTLVEKPEWQVLGRYNLGLVAQAQADMGAAIEYFRFSVQQQENERVRSLAQQKLNELEQQRSGLAAASDEQKPWTGLISISGGEDSNATSLADELLESSSSSEDYFHELLLYGHLQLSGRQGDGVRVYGLGFDRSFNTFDHLNSRVLGIGAVFEKSVEAYLLEGGVRVTNTSLDSREVANQWQLSAGVSRRFEFGTLNAGYAYSRFDAGRDFGQIDGDQHMVELGWRKQMGSVSVRSRYRFETNARDDLQRGGAFASYSPDRHGVRIEARWQASGNLSTGLIAEHIQSRYDGENRLRDTDGQVREAQRSNKQTKFNADISYRFNPNWRVKAEYQYTDQRDNFDIYNYDKHRLLGTVEFQFQHP